MAEILGWRPFHACDWGSGWVDADNNERMQPEVDDMLAWLKSQDRAVQIARVQPGLMVQVRVTRPGVHDERVLFSRAHNALTLHAALCAAVVAVAERGDGQ